MVRAHGSAGSLSGVPRVSLEMWRRGESSRSVFG